MQFIKYELDPEDNPNKCITLITYNTEIKISLNNEKQSKIKEDDTISIPKEDNIPLNREYCDEFKQSLLTIQLGLKGYISNSDNKYLNALLKPPKGLILYGSYVYFKI